MHSNEDETERRSHSIKGPLISDIYFIWRDEGRSSDGIILNLFREVLDPNFILYLSGR